MNVTIEKQADGTFIAYNKDAKNVSVIGTGDTVSEAKADFFNSIEEIKDSYAERGDNVPLELQGTPIFNFDISSLFEYYSMLNVSAFARYVGINDSLMRQYRKGNTYISDAQLAKIESGIHKLGQEFSNLRLV